MNFRLALSIVPCLTLAAAAAQESGSSAFRVGDYDGDGANDVYVIDPIRGDRLYRNRGDATFEDVTERASLGSRAGTRAATWRDVDGDGTLELIVDTLDGARRYFKNPGDGRFEDATAAFLALESTTFGGGGGSSALSSGCAIALVDQMHPEDCIEASTLPTIGKLMPLSRSFSIRGPHVGFNTIDPQAPIDVVLGDGRFQIRRDQNLVPAINITGFGGNAGVLRLRNALEVWPDDDATRAGRIDVRDTFGATRVAFDGGSGQANFVLGDKRLEILNDGNVAPVLNVTGTGGNVGILRLRNALEIWPDFAQTANGQIDVRDTNGNARCWMNGSGDARFLGSVGIATDAPAFTLHVNGSAGKPGGGAWSVASDERLKKDVRDLEGALERLLALRGVTYEYKEPVAIHELSGRQTGLIAQEVERVFPEWVEDGVDGFKRLAPRGFEALAVEALRDLRDEKDRQIQALSNELARSRAERDVEHAAFESLRRRVDEREARLDALVERLTSLEARARD